MAEQNGNFVSYLYDVTKQAHVLIAGATGSGKSVLLDDIVCCLLEEYDETQIQLCLIDPKRVGLSKYSRVKQCCRYADELDEAISIFNDCISLIESRYQLVKDCNDIESGVYSDRYNGSQVYIVIDELADLMVTGKKEVLPKLQRIAQLGRAAGVHLIAATQAPSRKIIPAELTLNFTCRIALRCDSTIESRQVIKVDGAERLPENGKAIIKFPNRKEPQIVDVPLLDNRYILNLIMKNIRTEQPVIEDECVEDEDEGEYDVDPEFAFMFDPDFGEATSCDVEEEQQERGPLHGGPTKDCSSTERADKETQQNKRSAVMEQAIRNKQERERRRQKRAEDRYRKQFYRIKPARRFDLLEFIAGWFKLGLKITFWTIVLAIIFI